MEDFSEAKPRTHLFKVEQSRVARKILLGPFFLGGSRQLKPVWANHAIQGTE